MNQGARLDIIDALRGFALIGILFVHVLQHFIPALTPDSVALIAYTNSFEEGLADSVYWIGMSKFFSIFSMLFGLSFYIQLRSGEAKGRRFRLLFFWKMLLLIGFGLFHRLIFQGDILLVYGLLGILLLTCWKIDSRALLIIAALLMLGAGRVLVFLITKGEPIFALTERQLQGDWVNAIVSGSFWDINQFYLFKLSQFADSQINVNWARAYITFAYFCVGIWVGRSGYLHDVTANLQKIRLVFYMALLASSLLLVLHLRYVGSTFGVFMHEYSTVQSLIKFTIFDALSFSMSILYASGFVLLFHKFSRFNGFRYLEAYGRTGLSTYILQSLLGTFLFYHWGLGLMNVLPLSYYLPVFMGMLLILMLFSYYWLKWFHYGPLEWLWRSLTYGQWVQNRTA